MPQVVYSVNNPNDPEQMYSLWDTGKIDHFGGALPVTGGPLWFTVRPPGAALHVTNWATGTGYVLDDGGGFNPFGGAPAVGPSDDPTFMLGIPRTAPGSGARLYLDWAWDPNNAGQGYVCDVYGQIYHFGGALACPRTGPLHTVPLVVRFDMQFAPFKRTVLMKHTGSRSQDFPFKALPADGYSDPNRDWVRDQVITHWGTFGTVDPSGLLLLASGIVHSWGPNKLISPFGGPFVGERGTQAALEMISPSDPMILAQFGNLGQFTRYVVSRRPTVTLTGPAALVVDSTRPMFTWQYSDPEKDRQDAWQLVVWPQSYVATHNMANPRLNRGKAAASLEGSDRTTRGAQCPVDLDNGSWRVYLRAQDTSGLWSAWTNRAWTQDVPLPTQPAALDVTVDRFQATLALLTPEPDDDLLAIFEWSHDGIVWTPVRGAEQVVLEESTTVIDYDIALGIPTRYRAKTFRVAPRVTSLPSPEIITTCQARTFVLTSCANPDLGGEVWPEGSMGWTRDVESGVFYPQGADYPIVVSSGPPKAWTRTLTLDSADRDGWKLIADLIESDSTLLLREPFGEVSYCRVVGSWSRDQIRALSEPGDPNQLAHVHSVGIPLQQVARPLPLPVEDDDV